MIAWKSLQLLLLCALLAAWSNAQAQEAKPNGSQLYSPANPKGGWKVKTQETRGAYSVLESVVQPSTGPEPHRHSREEEGAGNQGCEPRRLRNPYSNHLRD